MTQQEFNKQEQIQNLIKQAIEKNLSYRFVLEEFKRNKWNVNLAQSEEIGNVFGINRILVLLYALELNILNVDNKTRKILQKEVKRKNFYYEEV